MDDRRFDSLTRAFAIGQNRRSLIKGLLGLGGVLAGLRLVADEAGAQFCPITRRCNGACCPSGQTCCNGVCCPTGKCNTRPNPDICCSGINGDEICHNGCCQPGFKCCGGKACCPDTATCLPNGGCCAAANTPCGPDCCAPAEQCCDNECCNGVCYGEERCCPSTDTFCPATSECCSTGTNLCCDVDGCCNGACFGGPALNDFCCPAGTHEVCALECCDLATERCCTNPAGFTSCIPIAGCCDLSECGLCEFCDASNTCQLAPELQVCGDTCCDVEFKCCIDAQGHGECEMECCVDGDCDDLDPCTPAHCSDGLCNHAPSCADPTPTCCPDGQCRATC